MVLEESRTPVAVSVAHGANRRDALFRTLMFTLVKSLLRECSEFRARVEYHCDGTGMDCDVTFSVSGMSKGSTHLMGYSITGQDVSVAVDEITLIEVL